MQLTENIQPINRKYTTDHFTPDDLVEKSEDKR